MRRAVIRVLTIAALVTSTAMVAAPAQAATRCDVTYFSNGITAKCYGGQGQYRAEVYCQRADNTRYYWSVGAWRSFGGPNSSTAACNAGDYWVGTRVVW